LLAAATATTKNLMANQRIVAHLECVLVWRWPVALSTKMVVERGEERGERGDDYNISSSIW
jgi:hypothetical protein